MAKTKKTKKPKNWGSNARRAICAATIVTIVNGHRLVRKYHSGQQLVGRLPERADGMF